MVCIAAARPWHCVVRTHHCDSPGSSDQCMIFVVVQDACYVQYLTPYSAVTLISVAAALSTTPPVAEKYIAGACLHLSCFYADERCIHMWWPHLYLSFRHSEVSYSDIGT